MLIDFRSVPTLKPLLNIEHAKLIQLYILKLIKMQTSYFGPKWRAANMKIISAIYQKVRQRLTDDDWVCGNGNSSLML